MRRAARVDENHGEIVEAFEALGCSVVSLAPMGRGVPDLLIGVGLRTYLCEVKDGSKPPSARKLTPDEARFQKNWRGQWTLVESVADVIAFVKAWRREQ